MKFEWDPAKERKNVKKHGVSFEQASYVFTDPFALDKFDKEHSHLEERWLLLGKAVSEVILVVVHTFTAGDGEEVVRIISARKATGKEIQTYQNRCPQ